MARNMLGSHAKRPQSAAVGRANLAGGSWSWIPSTDACSTRCRTIVGGPARIWPNWWVYHPRLPAALATVPCERLIEREIAIVDPRVARARLTLIVMVTLERERPDLIDGFARAMRDATEVTQCYYVTGAMDYVLMVSVGDMAEYEEFTRRHLFGINVRRFETMAVMGRTKFTTAVALASA